MLNIFSTDPAFSVQGMTALVNKQPFVPGLIGASGVFENAGVSTLTVSIEEQHGDLALVAPTPRGGPGETTDNEKRNIRAFAIPHFQRDDSVTADEVQGVRAFAGDGTIAQVETLENKVAQKMRKHIRAFRATLEHQRCGAVRGVVVDKNNNIMADLYQTYGLTRPQDVEFDFGTQTFPFRKSCSQVMRTIEDALDEDYVIDGLDAYCGPDFFEAAIENFEYRSTFLNYPAAEALQKSSWIDSFPYGGIVWHRYRTGRRAAASATPAGATTYNGFIGKNEVRFVPRVEGLFLTRYAPADYMETVNTEGLPLYSKQWPMPNGKGIEMEVQMNAMSWCTRPEALLGGFSA